MFRSIALLLLLAFLPLSAAEWALPRVAVTSMRAKPAHSSEQVSQVVMGTPLKVLAQQGSWVSAESPEGYTGYEPCNTLAILSKEDMADWRASKRVIVTALGGAEVVPVDTLPMLPSARVSDLVSGCILQAADSIPAKGRVKVLLPDGRTGFVDRSDVMPLEQWAAQPWSAQRLIHDAAALMGAPYIWGGTSDKGMDCSGLVQLCAYRQGIMLPRDASQQAAIGKKIVPGNLTDASSQAGASSSQADASSSQADASSQKSGLMPGDLLFFGNRKTGRINHVAIYIGDDYYIHCSGRVRVSSLHPESPDYENPGLVAVRRLDPTTLSRHSLGHSPLYFRQ